MPKTKATEKNTEETVKSQEAQVAGAEASSIAEFNPFLAELERLTKEYGAVVYDVSKPEDFENAKKARRDIRDVRYAAQKAAAEILKPYQQKVKEAQEKVRDAKAIGEGLIEKVLLLETPIDDQIKAEEKRVSDEKERLAAIEADRINGIQTKISRFRNVSVEFGGSNAVDLAAALERVKAATITEEAYGEFEGEATIARDSAITQLETLHTLAVAREAEAERVDRERRELEELREKNRITEENAQRERDQRAKEDRERLAKQQAELDREREEMAAEKKRLADEKAELNAARQTLAAAPAPVAVAALVEPAASAVVEQSAPAEDPASPIPGAPTFEAIAEVVALGFDVDMDTAKAWLRGINA